ncbi:MAG TPA: FadR/GntR family transcriptional regulator [Paenibacillus sp.]|jgi:DNA-binding FadR family transcriptional regulator
MSEYVKPRKLVDLVLIELKRRIVNKEFSPGDRLPSEFELMTEYGVGRSTVREAVKILVHAGFLKIQHGQGTFVVYNENETSNDLPSGGHITETRMILEQAIVKLAVERRTEDDLIELRLYLDQRNDELQKGNYSTYIREDLAFHLAMAKATHNDTLADLYHVFSKSLEIHLNQFLLNIPNYSDNTMIHENIYRAILERNTQEALYWVTANIEVEKI